MKNNTSLLTRAIRVIDAVSSAPDGIRYSDVASVLDNPSPSTVSKILKELTQEGVIQKNAEGRYTLGRKVFFWGRVTGTQNTPIQVIREQMRRLRDQYQVSVNLFTRSEETMFCLESYRDDRAPLIYPAGTSLPLNLNVMGAIFLIPPEKLDDTEFLKQQAEFNDEPVALEDIQRMIDQARENNLQDDFGIFYPGLRRFAIPIKERGRTIMTLGVGVSPRRAEEGDMASRIVKDLQNIREWIESSFE